MELQIRPVQKALLKAALLTCIFILLALLGSSISEPAQRRSLLQDASRSHSRMATRQHRRSQANKTEAGHLRRSPRGPPSAKLSTEPNETAWSAIKEDTKPRPGYAKPFQVVRANVGAHAATSSQDHSASQPRKTVQDSSALQSSGDNAKSQHTAAESMQSRMDAQKLELAKRSSKEGSAEQVLASETEGSETSLNTEAGQAGIAQQKEQIAARSSEGKEQNNKEQENKEQKDKELENKEQENKEQENKEQENKEQENKDAFSKDFESKKEAEKSAEQSQQKEQSASEQEAKQEVSNVSEGESNSQPQQKAESEEASTRRLPADVTESTESASISKVTEKAAAAIQAAAWANKSRSGDLKLGSSNFAHIQESIAAAARPRQGLPEFQISFGTTMMSEAELWSARRDYVKLAVQMTWGVYEKYAFGFDELRPLSLEGVNNCGGLGTMILETIDSLYMMGLEQEYQRAAYWIANEMSLEHQALMSLPETTVKGIAGLLSVYDFTGAPIFLQRAATLTARMAPAFSDGVFPSGQVAFNGDQSAVEHAGDKAVLADFGSLQMEFSTLGMRLGVPALGELATFPVRFLYQTYPSKGLFPAFFNRTSGLILELPEQAEQDLAIDDQTAPFYENLLKMWLLGGKKDDMFKRMWQKYMDEALQLLYSASLDGSIMLGKRSSGTIRAFMEHVTCFVPGNIALGALQGAVDHAKLWFYMDNASKLMETCWRMYERTVSGLSPEEFHTTPDKLAEVASNDMSNRLRSEAVASLFYMWRATKDPKFRNMGWSIFRSFMQHSRTPEGAFARVKHTNELPVVLEDELPTHFTGSTLKYLWLIFGPDDDFNLNEWVFNTRGHPLKVAVKPDS